MQNNKNLKQLDKAVNSTVLSSKKWSEMGKPQLDGKIRHLDAFDGHRLKLL